MTHTGPRRSTAALLATSVLLLTAASPAVPWRATPDDVHRTAPGPSEGQTARDAYEDPEARAARDAWLEHADGLLVETAPGARATTLQEAVRGLALADAEVGRPVGGGYQRIDLPEPRSVEELQELAAQLVESGVVASAEPDYRVVPLNAPDDQYYDLQWNLHGRWAGTPIGDTYGINVEEAWTRTLGDPSMVVAVLDTGSLPHPDIVDRLVAGYDMISDPVQARDGDGRDPDPTDEGDWSSAEECSPPSEKPSSWHGLHVAGTIGASTDNGIGVAGVDRAASIQHVRVLGRCGGTSGDIAAAIRWAAGAKVPDVPLNATPARVLNLSLGGSAACPLTVQSAIDDAVALGAVIVVAAGNDNTNEPGFPANCDGVISVAATSPIGDRAAYSNYGSWVDIAAPGGDGHFQAPYGLILSTHNDGEETAGEFDYWFLAGTSMATPHVSGVASLLLAFNPALSPAQVREILLDSAQAFPPSPDFPDYECSNDPDSQNACGAGIVDAGAALAASYDNWITLDAKPNGALGVALAWDRATGTVGEVTYNVHRHVGAGDTCNPTADPRAETISTKFVDTGLVHGATYRYCVTAVDAGVPVAMSNAFTVVAKDAVAPPSPSLSVVAGERSAKVSWKKVVDPTIPVTYRVHRSAVSPCSSSNTVVYSGTGTSFTDRGLTAGATYRYCATARDGAGNVSPLSAMRSVVPTSPPLAFSDVKSTSTHAAGIAWMAGEGITAGCNAAGTKFCPHDPVTRAQMASFIARALDLQPGPKNRFVDVPSGNRHAAAIGAMHREGITLGCNTRGPRYCPQDVVTRAQMASFLSRAYELQPGPRNIFADVPSGSGHATSIGAMHREKITLGCATKPLRFCPDAPITRAEMATLIHRASKR